MILLLPLPPPTPPPDTDPDPGPAAASAAVAALVKSGPLVSLPAAPADVAVADAPLVFAWVVVVVVG